MIVSIPAAVLVAAMAASAAPSDADFAPQGEYAGCVLDGACCPVWTGLQVVAQGGGVFQAVEYRGGLPGNRWDMQNRRRLAGTRTAAGVHLSGDDRRVTIRGLFAEVSDAAGRPLGQLRKYQRVSQTLGAVPPSGATVLFGGRETSALTNGRMTADGLLMVGCETRQPYQDFTLHLEFRTPYMPKARGQARANSGIYIQGRYEVQILDSFGLDGLANECGGLYNARPPHLNMSFPPMIWQTYDIDFRAARFSSGGAKVEPARITVRHNGIVVHKNVALENKTGGGSPEGPDARPIRFQDHGNPVHFRNVWIIDRGGPSDRSIAAQ